MVVVWINLYLTKPRFWFQFENSHSTSPYPSGQACYLLSNSESSHWCSVLTVTALLTGCCVQMQRALKSTITPSESVSVCQADTGGLSAHIASVWAEFDCFGHQMKFSTTAATNLGFTVARDTPGYTEDSFGDF